MDNFNYPIGAEYDPKAPWNEGIIPEEEVEVLVTVVMSKTVKVKVSDYERIPVIDEDGNRFEDYDFSKCDLKLAVHRQVCTPDKAVAILKKSMYSDDLDNWSVDCFEATLK